MRKSILIPITVAFFLSLTAQTTTAKASETASRAWFRIPDNDSAPYDYSHSGQNGYSYGPNHSYEYGYAPDSSQRRYLRGYCPNCSRNRPVTSPCPALER